MTMILVEKIVSGGQTGVDRAALDWAILRGIEHGGWCPKGRLAEDGPIAAKYHLSETPSSEYAVRTEWNVRDADATLIVSLGESIQGGTELTRRLAMAYDKPLIHVSTDLGVDLSAKRLQQFLSRHDVRILNIAGPRALEEPGAGRFVHAVLDAVLRDPNKL